MALPPSMSISNVSTHSRPKAAAQRRRAASASAGCFNTQPPEGGCLPPRSYNTRAAPVSTHSRPKAAAGCSLIGGVIWHVSTHSRPKAAAKTLHLHFLSAQFQHTAARRRLPFWPRRPMSRSMFQHTAARRRLLPA